MVDINTTKPKKEFEICRSSCPWARFDFRGHIDCDPPMGECPLERKGIAEDKKTQSAERFSEGLYDK